MLSVFSARPELSLEHLLSCLSPQLSVHVTNNSSNKCLTPHLSTPNLTETEGENYSQKPSGLKGRKSTAVAITVSEGLLSA